eukprot:254727-Chlamydomonas_euryale.AAC.13
MGRGQLRHSTYILLELREETLLGGVFFVVDALDGQRRGAGRKGRLAGASLLCLRLDKVLQALVVDVVVLRTARCVRGARASFARSSGEGGRKVRAHGAIWRRDTRANCAAAPLPPACEFAVSRDGSSA